MALARAFGVVPYLFLDTEAAEMSSEESNGMSNG
jgi:hypothetical protein